MIRAVVLKNQNLQFLGNNYTLRCLPNANLKNTAKYILPKIEIVFLLLIIYF
jgi:hypothetical protein